MASVTRASATRVQEKQPTQEVNKGYGIFDVVRCGVHFLALARLASKDANETQKDMLARLIKEGKVTSFATMQAAIDAKNGSNDAFYADHFTKAGWELIKGGVKDLLFSKVTLGAVGTALVCYMASKVS